MREIKVFSDLHKGAPHEKRLLFQQYMNDGNTYLTGDIFDLKNTPKKELSENISRFEEAKMIFGRRYILGNHECESPIEYYFADRGVLFCHGHTLYWSEKKVKKWEKKKRGKSWIKYAIYRLKHLSQKEGKHKEPPLHVKEKCVELCKERKCHTIIFGHTHKYCDIAFKGIRIVNVRQGMTTLKISK